MNRGITLILALLLLPLSVSAATLRADESLSVAVSPTDNTYLAGANVKVSAPLPADLLALAGTLDVLDAIAGDALVAGGTIDLAGPVKGDVRATGGRVSIEQEVSGEVAVLGGVVHIDGKAGEIRAAGGTVTLTGGSAGDVSVYGGTVSLAGEYDGNVHIVSSDKISIGEGTIIHGTLEYNAPQEILIPASSQIDGGVTYIGSASFLPTAEEAQTFALAGIGIFFVVRMLAAMLAAGLLVGFFPLFAERIVEGAFGTNFKRFMFLFIVGFALMVCTPILLLLLLASFVGIGIAALLGATYVLALLLAYLLGALLAGALVARFVWKRKIVRPHDAMLGVVLLTLIGIVPGIGFLVTTILMAVALGSMATAFSALAFPKREI